MIFEYAVSPALFSSEERLLFLMEAFGIGQGRLVSDFPRRDWEKMARGFIDSCAKDPTQRHVWIEVLIAIRKYALHERQGPTWDDHLDWLSNALDEHTRPGRAFRAILAERGDARSESVLPLAVGLAKQELWTCPASRNVPRIASDMVRETAPLLNVSTSLILVDRHFNPRNESFVKVLVEFSRIVLTKTAQPKITQIKFVTAYDVDVPPMTIQAFAQNCVDVLPSSIPKGISVKFVLKAKALLHDRFVLTERGCIQFGQGLDEGKGHVQLNRLSEVDHRRELANWDQQAVHTFIVEGQK